MSVHVSTKKFLILLKVSVKNCPIAFQASLIAVVMVSHKNVKKSAMAVHTVTARSRMKFQAASSAATIESQFLMIRIAIATVAAISRKYGLVLSSNENALMALPASTRAGAILATTNINPSSPTLPIVNQATIS